MKLFIKNFTVLVVLTFCVFVVYNYYFYSLINWDNIELFEPEEGESFDVVVLGSSRSNPIYYNLLKKKKAISFGVGGGGLLIQKAYLEYFYEKISSEYMLYVIEPLCFCNAKYQIPENTMVQKLDFDFLGLLYEKLGLSWVLGYIRNYRTYEKHYGNDPQVIGEHYKISLDTIVESAEVKKEVDRLYKYCKRSNIKQQKEYIRNIISFSKQENIQTKLVFVIAPTLLGKEPLFEELIDFLEQMKKEHDIPYHDFSGKISSYKYFSDLTHLTEEGGSLFNENYILPILNGSNLEEK